jgi:hypothetical protein
MTVGVEIWVMGRDKTASIGTEGNFTWVLMRRTGCGRSVGINATGF